MFRSFVFCFGIDRPFFLSLSISDQRVVIRVEDLLSKIRSSSDLILVQAVKALSQSIVLFAVALC